MTNLDSNKITKKELFKIIENEQTVYNNAKEKLESVIEHMNSCSEIISIDLDELKSIKDIDPLTLNKICEYVESYHKLQILLDEDLRNILSYMDFLYEDYIQFKKFT